MGGGGGARRYSMVNYGQNLYGQNKMNNPGANLFQTLGSGVVSEEALCKKLYKDILPSS